MKLLFLVEKPFIKKRIEECFEKIKSSVDYDIDVAIVNCFVTSDEDAKEFHIDTKDFGSFSLETRKVPENYKILVNAEHYKTAAERIASLAKKNKYDILVNACDPDEAGGLMFDYTRETCGLLEYKTFKFNIEAFYIDNGIGEFKRLELETQKTST